MSKIGDALHKLTPWQKGPAGDSRTAPTQPVAVGADGQPATEFRGARENAPAGGRSIDPMNLIATMVGLNVVVDAHWAAAAFCPPALLMLGVLDFVAATTAMVVWVQTRPPQT